MMPAMSVRICSGRSVPVGPDAASGPCRPVGKGKKMKKSDDRIIQASVRETIHSTARGDAALGTRAPPNSPKHAPNHRPGFGIRVFIVPMWGRGDVFRQIRPQKFTLVVKHGKARNWLVAALFLCNRNHRIRTTFVS